MTRYSLLAALLVSIIIVSCSQSRYSRQKYTEDYERMVVGYCSTNTVEAEKALLQFRDKIRSTRGFEEVQDPNYALALVEARLFGLHHHQGDTNTADRFFESSVQHFARYHSATTSTNAVVSRADLLNALDRLDAQLDVRWKK